jgi:predicted PurR-regulated permease PerM
MARSVNGYVVGQAINSALFGIFALVVLTILGVPAATVLAFIAAIGDAIPQIGVTLATIPAAILALTVSPQTAILVIGLYVAYQQIENFITSPRVFSKTLKLSPLMTLFAVIIGGNLLGVIGVLFALPITASIPPVWRIWTGQEMAGEDEAAGPDPASGNWL